MSAFSETVEAETLEQLLPLVAIGIGFWVLYRVIKDQLTVSGFFATVQGPADFVGNGKPLTFPQAQGIAQLIGVDEHGGSWKQSPDALQIWFADQSYYDNITAHFWEHSGGETVDDGAGNVGVTPDVLTDKGDLRTVINSMKG